MEPHTIGHRLNCREQEKVNIGLGYVEAKIKIPSSKGIWPAFWMLGTNGKKWPACGEIDIMEAFNTRSDIQSTIHYPKWNGADRTFTQTKMLITKQNGIHMDVTEMERFVLSTLMVSC